MEQITVNYVYIYAGISTRKRTRELLKKQALRNLLKTKGTVLNGIKVTNVTIYNDDSDYPEVCLEGDRR